VEPKQKNSEQKERPPGWENKVAGKEERKLRARQRKKFSIWFGFGYFGVIGWSIAIPTLLGIFAGLWIDRNFASSYSWTLMLMIGGLTLGIFSAWYWIQFESDMIDREDHGKDKRGK
jgi:ATP synthase protein I